MSALAPLHNAAFNSMELLPRCCRHAAPRRLTRIPLTSRPISRFSPRVAYRNLQTSSTSHSRIPDFAFAFDIDGVLIRGAQRLPHAAQALTYLQRHSIPFILLTNGGGYDEEIRAEKLTEEIGVPLDPSMIVQSHTPFADMDEYKDGCTLVVGGEHDNCRLVAQNYGFTNVVTPSDIFRNHPELWPFSRPLAAYHHRTAHDTSHRIDVGNPATLKVDSIFVYNDPRDWGLDISLIVDCLLSQGGRVGTLSSKNGDAALPNRGYQQDGQPPLFFSNPDLWFAAEFATPRLGQGGFREALEGVWAAVTSEGTGLPPVKLQRTVIGKPHRETYLFAERKLNRYREATFGGHGRELPKLKNVYMVGDNPASDIMGAMNYKSPFGTTWSSALVRTGVYAGGEPAAAPSTTVDHVGDAVRWAVKDSGWANDID
ncbi:hypothetical protein FH972_023990 [Carpinus fangiana]|uniref:TIGR01456 family HAD hydrolase n=1 Tax=Carpinus fangiana TaxID=176857 RepID=A0A5N6KX86_9ROSI|nr:hypothetical protein FH972_023990 [Carpinus fangiana]